MNFAYHASQNGVEGWAVSAVGNDDAGRDLLAVTASYGIRTLVATVDKPTGTVDVSLCDGQPTYTIHEHVAWDYIPLTEEMLSLARRAGAICFGTLAQRGEVSHRTTCAMVETVPADAYRIYDINLRQHFYSKELIDRSLRIANVLKINDTNSSGCRRCLRFRRIRMLRAANWRNNMHFAWSYLPAGIVSAPFIPASVYLRCRHPGWKSSIP